MSIPGTAIRPFSVSILAMVTAVAMALMVIPPAQAQFKTLYEFTGKGDGANPNAGVSAVVSPGGLITLYGSTLYGGDLNCNPPLGCGGVYKINVGGKFYEVHKFLGGKDGELPYAAPIWDVKNKLLVGTTSAGGLGTCFGFGCGVVYGMTLKGQINFQIPFDGGTGGGMPFSGLKIDPKDNKWGTTTFGGNLSCGVAPPGCGTIFEIDPTGKVTVRYTFLDSKDGAFPLYSSVTADPLWKWIYVTTQKGGDLTCKDGAGEGCGEEARVEVAPPNNYQPEHSFEGTDGEFPESGVVFTNGIAYGTTSTGGSNGKGVVFQFDPKKKAFFTLHNFGIGSDGAIPIGGLATDGPGNLYGVTEEGGANGEGMLFKIDSSGKETDLHDFDQIDGYLPVAAVTYVGKCGCASHKNAKSCKGCLFGTTSQSSPGQGTVWQYTLP